VRILDERLKHWDDHAFLQILPELRLAFSELTPRETDRVAAAAAGLHGAATLGNLVNYEIDEKDLAFNVALNEALCACLNEDGLGAWIEVVPTEPRP
jgi:hypothetical protein